MQEILKYRLFEAERCIMFAVNADFKSNADGVKTVLRTGVCLADFTHGEFHNHKLQRIPFEWILCVFRNSWLFSVFEFLNDCYLIRCWRSVCVPKRSCLSLHLSHIASMTDPVIYLAQIEKRCFEHWCSLFRSKWFWLHAQWYTNCSEHVCVVGMKSWTIVNDNVIQIKFWRGSNC